ncbi:MAG: (deoxy)nucleoside triphosphate pyrophosphohydrolase, partial [Deltaproteobacteria bacterium]|nr:(deoxy)nucleoside triphosphate pyrophosphohydrolase [Deltaproteobacteria bacterium]
MGEKSIRVVAAVIQRGDRYLITQRRASASMPLFWEFPGGKVEQGETDAEALRREVLERIGATIEIGSPAAFRRHDYEGYSVELVLYEATLLGTDEEVAALKVKDYKWVEAQNMGDY